MKDTRKLTLTLITLFIVLLFFISFLGIYIKDLNKMKNMIPEYLLGMDLKGARNVKLEVDRATVDKITDAEGNMIEEATDEEIEQNGYQVEQIPVNGEAALTKENFKICKEIIEKRLKDFKVGSYVLRQDAKTGDMTIELEENYNTDELIPYLYTPGEFLITDAKTNEILINNNDIQDAKVMYGADGVGTSVYLQIEFTKEGTKKLREISKTYVAGTDEEGNSTTKNVSLELDRTTNYEHLFWRRDRQAECCSW